MKRFNDNIPIAPCPHFTEGVLRYKFIDGKGYLECSEVLCGYIVKYKNIFQSSINGRSVSIKKASRVKISIPTISPRMEQLHKENQEIIKIMEKCKRRLGKI